MSEQDDPNFYARGYLAGHFFDFSDGIEDGQALVFDGTKRTISPGQIAGGAGIAYGPGAPSSGTGSDGQFYVDTTNHRLYGPKATGEWPAESVTLGSGSAVGSSIATVTTVTVDTSATLAVESDSERLSHEIFNPDDAITVYYGTTDSVTSGNGVAIGPGGSKRGGVIAGSYSDGYTGDVYLIAGSGSVDVIVVTVGV